MKKKTEFSYKDITLEAVKDLNCSSELLSFILSDLKDDVISQYAALNPNTPVHILEKILDRDICDGLSQYAAANLSCPSECFR